MGRPTKTQNERKYKLSVTIDKDTNDKLDKFVEEKMIIKSKLVNRILKDYLENQNAKARD